MNFENRKRDIEWRLDALKLFKKGGAIPGDHQIGEFNRDQQLVRLTEKFAEIRKRHSANKEGPR